MLYCARFSLRFEQAGFFITLHPINIFVGPIISAPFFRALDGSFALLLSALNRLLGPFSTVPDYLSSWVGAER